jgi:hypothetical protein
VSHHENNRPDHGNQPGHEGGPGHGNQPGHEGGPGHGNQPGVEIENRPVIAALRRSAHLVRQHFWKVVLLATLPASLAAEVTSAAPHSTGLTDLLTAFAIRGIADALIEAVLGLVLAETFYRLIELHRDRPAPRYEGGVLTGAKTTAATKNRGTGAAVNPAPAGRGIALSGR